MLAIDAGGGGCSYDFNLGIDSDRLSDISDTFNNGSSNYGLLISDIGALVNEMGDYWTGDAYNAFKAKWEETANAFNTYKDVVGAMGNSYGDAYSNASDLFKALGNLDL